MTDQTERKRPVPGRPATGWGAWQATVGYIAGEYSPDALLNLTVTPLDNVTIVWKAIVSWGSMSEEVDGLPTLAAALAALWAEVDQHHRIFKTLEATARKPAGYRDDRWLDPETADVLTRLLNLCASTFVTDWRLIILYQPVADPGGRVQVRLLVGNGTINTSGRAGTLAEACHVLFHNAATHFRSTWK